MQQIVVTKCHLSNTHKDAGTTLPTCSDTGLLMVVLLLL